MEDHLESLSSKYTGHGACMRLQSVASYSGNPEGVRGQAHRAAVSSLKSTHDVSLYERLCDQSKRDTAWIASTSKQYNDRMDALKAELRTQESLAVRDGIRRALMDIGAHQATRGEFLAAIAIAQKAKEHCADVHQNLSVTASLVEWACMAKDWNTVWRNVDRGELYSCPNEGLKYKITAALGLYEFTRGNFPEALTLLGHLPASLAGDFAPLHPEEAGLYAMVCALVTQRRGEVRRQWCKLPACKAAMESYPALRSAVEEVEGGRFGGVTHAFQALVPFLAMDPYACNAVPTLALGLRENLLRQYAAPFSRFSLASARSAIDGGGGSGGGSSSSSSHFPPYTLDAVESDVCSAVQGKKLAGRVDGVEKTFTAWAPNERARVLGVVKGNAEAYLKSSREMLLRLALDKVKVRGGGGKGGKGGKYKGVGGGGAANATTHSAHGPPIPTTANPSAAAAAAGGGGGGGAAPPPSTTTSSSSSSAAAAATAATASTPPAPVDPPPTATATTGSGIGMDAEGGSAAAGASGGSAVAAAAASSEQDGGGGVDDGDMVEDDEDEEYEGGGVGEDEGAVTQGESEEEEGGGGGGGGAGRGRTGGEGGAQPPGLEDDAMGGLGGKGGGGEAHEGGRGGDFDGEDSWVMGGGGGMYGTYGGRGGRARDDLPPLNEETLKKIGFLDEEEYSNSVFAKQDVFEGSPLCVLLGVKAGVK